METLIEKSEVKEKTTEEEIQGILSVMDTTERTIQIKEFLLKNQEVKLTFQYPIQLPKKKLGNTIKFNSFFISRYNRFCYGLRKICHLGYPLEDNFIEKIIGMKVISYLMDFQQFSNKFDKRFISDKEILKLWDDGSAMRRDYGKYQKNDFKRISKQGKICLNKFLSKFKNIYEITEFYNKSQFGDYKVLTECNNSYSARGRDITIEHSQNHEKIYYSSEFSGCGNGDYYLLANENEVLYLERD